MSKPPVRAEENRMRGPLPAVSSSGAAAETAATSAPVSSVGSAVFGAIGSWSPQAEAPAAAPASRARSTARKAADCEVMAGMASSWDGGPGRGNPGRASAAPATGANLEAALTWESEGITGKSPGPGLAATVSHGTGWRGLALTSNCGPTSVLLDSAKWGAVG